MELPGIYEEQVANGQLDVTATIGAQDTGGGWKVSYLRFPYTTTDSEGMYHIKGKDQLVNVKENKFAALPVFDARLLLLARLFANP